MDWNALRKAMGPGILFAGTAIGVSHLVQSTRAGASYGYWLLMAVILANFFKYPFFEFGSRYAQVTGTSLLSGYQSMGRYALWLYAGISLLTMFTVTGGVTAVTVALLNSWLGLESPDAFIFSAVGLYLMCFMWLFFGRYRLLDRFAKWIAVLLTCSTIVAFAMALTGGRPHNITEVQFADFDKGEMFVFAIALMGWMPTAVDLSAWSSIWTVERMKEQHYRPSLKQVLFDFRLGYLLSAALAIVFLVLGAEFMFYRGEQFPEGSVAFTNRLLSLFSDETGVWGYHIFAIAALSVMLSTSVTVFDGYSRAMNEVSALIRNGPVTNGYTKWLLVVSFGGMAVILLFNNQMKQLVDLATIISFVVAPVIAVLNYRLMYHSDVMSNNLPGNGMKWWALSGVVFLSLFTLLYLIQLIS